MKAHWTSLAHAQDVMARLLEAVIDAAPSLTPLEIEGEEAIRADGMEPDTRARHYRCPGHLPGILALGSLLGPPC
jgi:hypothetical protein